MAPPGPTFIEKINVKIIEGKINFEVTYKDKEGKPVISNIYLSGIKINSNPQ